MHKIVPLHLADTQARLPAEDVLFVADSVTTKFNTSVHPEVTYSLEIGYNYPVYFTFLNLSKFFASYIFDKIAVLWFQQYKCFPFYLQYFH